jgi:hypothetical protein
MKKLRVTDEMPNFQGYITTHGCVLTRNVFGDWKVENMGE